MFRKFLKDYFTFSRTERNGLIVLVIIIAVLIAAQVIIPHIRKNITYDFSEFQQEIDEFEKSHIESGDSGTLIKTSGEGSHPASIDPNSATSEELMNAGLEQRVVRNIMKYRDKGGRFRTREDLKKIYGLDSTEYLEIERYILIRTDSAAEGYLTEESTSDNGLGREERYDRPLVPINMSDSSDLAGIYGIGPVLSARIIKYRKLLGGYVSKDQLLEVYGMTRENYENIKDFLYVDSLRVSLIDLNTATFEELSRHPYLTDYQAKSIIAYRELQGRFTFPDEIFRNNLLPENTYKKIRPYLVTE